MVVTRGYESRGAGVFDLIRIWMDAPMQLGRRAERQGPEKSRGTKDRDGSTDDRAAFH